MSINMKYNGVSGIEAGITAMRNPMNSWRLGDTMMVQTEGAIIEDILCLGCDDEKLSQKLYKAGTEHCKHLRMIFVYLDIKAPRYWWQEFDTYKVGVEKVSCSTMHKLFENGLSIEDFDINPKDHDVIEPVITRLNEIRVGYKETKNSELLIRAKQILPESYLQLRTVCISFQALANIVNQRHNHRLPEWREFCEFVFDKVEYFGELTDLENK